MQRIPDGSGVTCCHSVRPDGIRPGRRCVGKAPRRTASRGIQARGAPAVSAMDVRPAEGSAATPECRPCIRAREIRAGSKRASTADPGAAAPKASAVKSAASESSTTMKAATPAMKTATAATASAGTRRSGVVNSDRQQAGKKQSHQTRFDEGGHDELHGNHRSCKCSLAGSILFNPKSTKLFPPASVLRQRRTPSCRTHPDPAGW